MKLENSTQLEETIFEIDPNPPQNREERIFKRVSVNLPGSRHAKSKIVVEYREIRIYVHLHDCSKKITWLFEYNNCDDQIKLNYIIEIFTSMKLEPFKK